MRSNRGHRSRSRGGLAASGRPRPRVEPPATAARERGTNGMWIFSANHRIRFATYHAQVFESASLARDTAERRVEIMTPASALNFLGSVNDQLPLFLWDAIVPLELLRRILDESLLLVLPDRLIRVPALLPSARPLERVGPRWRHPDRPAPGPDPREGEREQGSHRSSTMSMWYEHHATNAGGL